MQTQHLLSNLSHQVGNESLLVDWVVTGKEKQQKETHGWTYDLLKFIQKLFMDVKSFAHMPIYCVRPHPNKNRQASAWLFNSRAKQVSFRTRWARERNGNNKRPARNNENDVQFWLKGTQTARTRCKTHNWARTQISYEMAKTRRIESYLFTALELKLLPGLESAAGVCKRLKRPYQRSKRWIFADFGEESAGLRFWPLTSLTAESLLFRVFLASSLLQPSIPLTKLSSSQPPSKNFPSDFSSVPTAPRTSLSLLVSSFLTNLSRHSPLPFLSSLFFP